MTDWKFIRFLLVALPLLCSSFVTWSLTVLHSSEIPRIFLSERTSNDDELYGDDVISKYVTDKKWIDFKLISGKEARNRGPADDYDDDYKSFLNDYYYDDDGGRQRSQYKNSLKKRGIMGLDNVDYVSSTLDLHRTLIGGSRGGSSTSAISEPPRSPPSARFRSRPNHRQSGSPMTSRLPVRVNVSVSEMRRMMQTLLEVGRR